MTTTHRLPRTDVTVAFEPEVNDRGDVVAVWYGDIDVTRVALKDRELWWAMEDTADAWAREHLAVREGA